MKFIDKTRWPIERIGKALIMALLPLVCCLVYCALQGQSLMDVYLPASEWNDELFYYKQVEAILENGYPYGYYGFNESHAAYLSFAAWSPVLVTPWVLWGALFGWPLLSPIWCNLFLMSLAIFIFVYLTKPGYKQMGGIAALYCLFPMVTRYVLSGMPEIICFSLVLVFYGVAISYLQEKASKGKLICLFVMSVLMTLMRPYLILFVFLPIFLWVRQYRKWWTIAGSFAILLATFGIYVLIHTLLGAEYLEPLFSVEWVTVMLEEGFLEGVKFVLYTLMHRGMQFVSWMIEGFRSGYVEGVFFAVFLISAILLTVQCVLSFRKKKETEWIMCGHSVFTFIGMLAALLLMYGMSDGSRHLNTFVFAGIFLVAMMDTKYFAKTAVLGVLFFYLFTVKGDNPLFYQVPFKTPERVEWIQYWEDTFEEEIQLNMADIPNYDNVIIWVLSDSKGDEAPVLTQWQALYGVPKGMGISCCFSDYINANIDQLKCKYIATLSGGSVDENSREAGFKEIGRKGDVVVYRVR